MTAQQPILVGIDFSPSSRAALAHGIRLANASSSPVRAVHVIDTLVATDLSAVLSPLVPDIRAQLLKEATDAWPGFVDGLDGTAQVPLDVSLNNRVAGITQSLMTQRASLLVIGTYGDRPLDVGIGTMATACIRRSPIDVLLVRNTKTGPFKHIVACVDFSPTSRRALERAAELARLEQAQLRIVHVFEPPWKLLRQRNSALDVQLAQQYRKELEGRLQAFVREAGEGVAAARPVCEVFDSTGYRNGITEYAELHAADLVVLGTRGRTNMRDVLLGSTAEKVLKETKCSIFAIKPGDA